MLVRLFAHMLDPAALIQSAKNGCNISDLVLDVERKLVEERLVVLTLNLQVLAHLCNLMVHCRELQGCTGWKFALLAMACGLLVALRGACRAEPRYQNWSLSIIDCFQNLLVALSF